MPVRLNMDYHDEKPTSDGFKGPTNTSMNLRGESDGAKDANLTAARREISTGAIWEIEESEDEGKTEARNRPPRQNASCHQSTSRGIETNKQQNRDDATRSTGLQEFQIVGAANRVLQVIPGPRKTTVNTSAQPPSLSDPPRRLLTLSPSQFASRLKNMENVIAGLKDNVKNQRATIHQQTKEAADLTESLSGLQVALRAEADLVRERDAEIWSLKDKIILLEGEAKSANDNMTQIIRERQEESFKRIESDLWLPRDESQVKADLERLKRLMKGVTKDIAAVTLREERTDSDDQNLFTSFEDILRWDANERLLPGMNRSKMFAVILNALLAHHVYFKLINSPFFIFDRNFDRAPLDNLYAQLEGANPADAHMWRAQILRTLYPRISASSNAKDNALHQDTDSRIVEAALKESTRFMSGPASLLIKSEVLSQPCPRIEDIFIHAARLSYDLWTRKTSLRAFSIQSFNPEEGFDIDSQYLTPHTLVKYDDYDDQLFDQPIKMIVHPLLMVYGTDEGEKYDQGRVWMPAEVWVPGR